MADKTLNYYDQETQTWKSPYATQTDLTNLGQTVNDLNNTVTINFDDYEEHLNNPLANSIILSRDISLSGTQTAVITGLRPRYIEIKTSVRGSETESIGSYTGGIYNTLATFANGQVSGLLDSVIAVGQDDTSFAKASLNIEQVTGGYKIDLIWTQVSVGGTPSGVADIFVKLFYHGEVV